MTRIGCSGILVADTFCGPMQALPIAGELLAIDAMVTRAGGCAANVAISLAKQGVMAEVCACVGDDAPAQVVINALQRAGADTTHVSVTADFPTSQTVILLVEGEDRRYVHVFGANRAFSTAHITPEWLDTLDMFYLGGLFVMPALDMDELRDVLAYCQGKGIQTVVDVVVPQQSEVGMRGLAKLLPHIDCFLPNEIEAGRLTGKSNPREQIDFLQKHGANNVIITQGKGGVLASLNGTLWQVGAYAVDTVDPSGSGDAFTAGVITGMVNGWSDENTLRFASALGASCTLKIGTTDGVFKTDEAQAFIAANALAVTTV